MTNEEIIKDFKPKSLWKYFSELSQIPRSSGKEIGVRNWLIDFAKSNNLEFKTDKVGNLVIYKNSQKSNSTQTVLLQAHMDMVCEKNQEIEHDFLKDPIKFKLNGDYLFAQGTTLGSDNGIGLAAILAILEDKIISHPKIVALFTVLEETGVNGALELDKSLISGDIILNLDSEEEGEVFIGCAGSRNIEFKPHFKKEKPRENSKCYEIKISGLRGGHSGVNIHENRVNGIKLLALILKETSLADEFSLSSIDGGNMRNAIPRYSEAVFYSDKKVEILELIIKSYLEKYKNLEPDLEIILEEKKKANIEVFPSLISIKILNLLNSIHSGVYEMSQEIEGLVQSSNNLGVVKTEEGEIKIITMSRSSNKTQLENICGSILGSFEMFLNVKSSLNPWNRELQKEERNNYFIELDVQSPSWQPDPQIGVLDLFQKSHEKIMGKKALVKAIHAGLEAGIIKTYLPNSEAISFGPQISNAHSPSESVKISTVESFYKILVDLLGRI